MNEGAPERTYTAAEIETRLKDRLPFWRFSDGHLRREYKTKNWKSTLMLVNAIGYLAEAAWHHPDLAVSYDSVGVRLMTHSAKGITDKDFALASKIEALVMGESDPIFQQPPASARLLA